VTKKPLRTIRHLLALPCLDLSHRIDQGFANVVDCLQSAPTLPSNVPKKDVNATATLASLASAEPVSTHPNFLYINY
jgi:hypothetical protein